MHMVVCCGSLWTGLEMALAQNLTRAIGVSSYKSPQISALLEHAKVVPAVNQCDMSLKNRELSTSRRANLACNPTARAVECLPVLGS